MLTSDQLDAMGTPDLLRFLDAMMTLDAVQAGLSCQPRFGRDERTDAGRALDDFGDITSWYLVQIHEALRRRELVSTDPAEMVLIRKAILMHELGDDIDVNRLAKLTVALRIALEQQGPLLERVSRQ